MADEPSVSGALLLISDQLARLSEQFGSRAPRPAPPQSSGPFEQLIVRYSIGTGTVRRGIDDQPFFVLHGDLYDLAGVRDGEYEGVYHLRAFTPEVLESYPQPPQGPFDRPPTPGTEDWLPVLNGTTSKWTLGSHGDEITAVGPALARAAFHRKGGLQVWVGVSGFVAGGSGRYEGAIGQVTALGSSFFTQAPALTEGFVFDINVFHCLKLLVRQDRGTPPLPDQGGTP